MTQRSSPNFKMGICPDCHKEHLLEVDKSNYNQEEKDILKKFMLDDVFLVQVQHLYDTVKKMFTPAQASVAMSVLLVFIIKQTYDKRKTTFTQSTNIIKNLIDEFARLMDEG